MEGEGEEGELLPDALVHAGFMEAFRSIRPALLQVLHAIISVEDAMNEEMIAENISTSSNNNINSNGNSNGDRSVDGNGSDERLIKGDTRTDIDIDVVTDTDTDVDTDVDEEEPWDIYITGHSLGGALATLFSFELGLARQRLGRWAADEQDDYCAAYRSNDRFMSILRKASITKHSYGAPRVGNPTFACLFDTWIPDAYRVVNNQDLVARKPRSEKINNVMPYKHVGKTALFHDENLGVLWVQRESKGGVSPIADLSPFGKGDVDIVISDLSVINESGSNALDNSSPLTTMRSTSTSTSTISSISNSTSNPTINSNPGVASLLEGINLNLNIMNKNVDELSKGITEQLQSAQKIVLQAAEERAGVIQSMLLQEVNNVMNEVISNVGNNAVQLGDTLIQSISQSTVDVMSTLSHSTVNAMSTINQSTVDVMSTLSQSTVDAMSTVSQSTVDAMSRLTNGVNSFGDAAYQAANPEKVVDDLLEVTGLEKDAILQLRF